MTDAARETPSLKTRAVFFGSMMSLMASFTLIMLGSTAVGEAFDKSLELDSTMAMVAVALFGTALVGIALSVLAVVRLESRREGDG